MDRNQSPRGPTERDLLPELRPHAPPHAGSQRLWASFREVAEPNAHCRPREHGPPPKDTGVHNGPAVANPPQTSILYLTTAHKNGHVGMTPKNGHEGPRFCGPYLRVCISKGQMHNCKRKHNYCGFIFRSGAKIFAPCCLPPKTATSSHPLSPRPRPLRAPAMLVTPDLKPQGGQNAILSPLGTHWPYITCQ